MIRSFGDKPTEALFRDERVRQFAGIARVAKRKRGKPLGGFDRTAIESFGKAQGRSQGVLLDPNQ
jgi:hypothetical protein